MRLPPLVAAREIQAKKEIVGCTFKPKLNRKTEAMARQGKKKTSVEKRLYEDGLKKEIEKRNKTAKSKRDRDRQSKEWEEREYREHCTFRPQVGERLLGDSTDVKTVGEVGGVKEWLEQQQRGKAAKAEREAREKEMKLRGEERRVASATDFIYTYQLH